MSRFQKTRIVSGTILNQMIRGDGDDCDQEITVTYDNSYTAGVRIDREEAKMIATLRDQHGEIVLELHDSEIDLEQDFLFEGEDDYTFSLRRGALNTLTSADRQQYLLTHGVRCPFCGSDDLHTSVYQSDFNGEVTQQSECLSCEATWVDVYELAGIRNETPPIAEVTMLDGSSSAAAPTDEETG